MPRKVRVEFPGAVYRLFVVMKYAEILRLTPFRTRDKAGNLKQYQNPAGQTKYLNYDNRNRVWDTWWDGGVGPLISTRYDAASRVTSLTTDKGRTEGVSPRISAD